MEVFVLGLAGLFCIACAYFVIYFIVAANTEYTTYHFLDVRAVFARYIDLFS